MDEKPILRDHKGAGKLYGFKLLSIFVIKNSESVKIRLITEDALLGLFN